MVTRRDQRQKTRFATFFVSFLPQYHTQGKHWFYQVSLEVSKYQQYRLLHLNIKEPQVGRERLGSKTRGEYFQQIEAQLSIFSEDLMVVDAMKSFGEAFELIDQEIQIDSTIVSESLTNYYSHEFFPRLSENSTGLDYESANYFEEYRTQLLQYLYISGNEHEVGEKHNLIDIDFPVTYNSVHRHYHSKFKNYLEK